MMLTLSMVFILLACILSVIDAVQNRSLTSVAVFLLSIALLLR